MRYLLTFLLMAWSSLLFAKEENLPPDIQNILSRGQLVVAVIDQDISPFIFQEKAKLDGYDIAIAQNIAKQLGVQLVFNRNAKTFDEVIEQLVNHKADMAISLLSRTLPRALKVNFSAPYLLLHQALLINRIKAIQLKLMENPTVVLNDPRATIAVLQNSAYMTFVKTYYPKATLLPYKNLDQAMLDVKNGKILTVLFDEIQIQEWLNKHADAHLYVEMLILTKQIDPIAIALPWQSTHLLRWVDTYLMTLKDDEQGKYLVKHYLKDSKWLER
jgi:ABC-type amino acid transport substrate-binding protein